MKMKNTKSCVRDQVPVLSYIAAIYLIVISIQALIR